MCGLTDIWNNTENVKRRDLQNSVKSAVINRGWYWHRNGKIYRT